MQIRRLGSGQNFICKGQDLVFDAFSYSEPVEGVKDRGDVTELRGLDNSTCKRILNLLEAGYLRLW